jgi:hypothetical protein
MPFPFTPRTTKLLRNPDVPTAAGRLPDSNAAMDISLVLARLWTARVDCAVQVHARCASLNSGKRRLGACGEAILELSASVTTDVIALHDPGASGVNVAFATDAEDAMDSNFRRALFELLGLTFQTIWKDGQPTVVLVTEPPAPRSA